MGGRISETPGGGPAPLPRRELIDDLARRLLDHPTVERVWLFGSRARGDAFERSDIDLAIDAPGMPEDEWVRLHLDFPEEAPTLLMVDLVRCDRADDLLKRQIDREGILLGERRGPETT